MTLLEKLQRYLPKRSVFYSNRSNVYSTREYLPQGTAAYYVYSWGRHWPMALYYEGQWVFNSTKPPSQSTARQMSTLRRVITPDVERPVEDLISLRDAGYFNKPTNKQLELFDVST